MDFISTLLSTGQVDQLLSIIHVVVMIWLIIRIIPNIHLDHKEEREAWKLESKSERETWLATLETFKTDMLAAIEKLTDENRRYFETKLEEDVSHAEILARLDKLDDLHRWTIDGMKTP